MKKTCCLLWTLCVSSAAIFAAQAAPNAVEIYKKAFELYPSKEIVQLKQKERELTEDLATHKIDPNTYRKTMSDLQNDQNRILQKTINNYAEGSAPFDASIKNFLSKQQPVLNLIWQACAIKTCDWSTSLAQVNDPTREIDEIFTRCDDMNNLFLLALADAQQEADTSHYNKAIHKTFSALAIIHHTGNSSILEHLICLRMEKIYLEFLQRLLGQMPLDSSLLNIIETRLKNEADIFPSLHESLLGEKLLFTRNLSEKTIKDLFPMQFRMDPNLIPHITETFIQDSIEYNNHYMEQICSYLDLPYRDASKNIQQMELKTAQEARIVFDPNTQKIIPENILKTKALLTALSSPIYSAQYRIHTKQRNHLNATLAALKIYQY
ncbi:MAG: hypothetical protein ABFD91_06575 [Anaerohalosphaeraceae bacterium]